MILPLRNRAVQAWLALVNSMLSRCNHQSLAVTTPERYLSAKDPVPRQLVVVNFYQGIKNRAAGSVWKKTYTIFISTALGIKARGSRKNALK